jgi:hypothetical protein
MRYDDIVSWSRQANRFLKENLGGEWSASYEEEGDHNHMVDVLMDTDAIRMARQLVREFEELGDMSL